MSETLGDVMGFLTARKANWLIGQLDRLMDASERRTSMPLHVEIMEPRRGIPSQTNLPKSVNAMHTTGHREQTKLSIIAYIVMPGNASPASPIWPRLIERQI